MNGFAPDVSIAIDWLGTFAVHSTLALGAAWLVSVLLGRRALSLQENLLRVSLWLAVLSASLQCALRGVWTPELVLSPDVTTAAAPAPGVAALLAPASATAANAIPWWGQWWGQLPWPTVVVGTAAFAALGGFAWLAIVHRRLRRVLRARQPETDARVLTTAAEVARQMGLQQSPQMSRSAGIATPIAFGFLRPEICLPVRVGELGAPSLRAMLAHEVAHLRAADPAWMWGAACLQALFPWQPLFVVVRRRWARLVELRCDAIAAQHATPTAVARCLLDVADWLRPVPEGTFMALGMAARPSALRERVEAALQGATHRPSRRAVARALGSFALGALTIGAPAVATERPLAEANPTLAISAPPAASASTGRAQLRGSLAALLAEHTNLLGEAERLRGELRAHVPAAEFAKMQAELDRRLQTLAGMRTRLEALLARTVSGN
jgi:beta-lactamase regulating signal transducer with metallopeptidase domain